MSDRKTTELIYQNYIFLYTNQLLLFSSEFVDIDMADDVKYIFYCLGMDIDILEDKFAPPTPPPIVPIPNPTSKHPPMPGCHGDINDNPLSCARRTEADMQKNKFHCVF